MLGKIFWADAHSSNFVELLKSMSDLCFKSEQIRPVVQSDLPKCKSCFDCHRTRFQIKTYVLACFDKLDAGQTHEDDWTDSLD